MKHVFILILCMGTLWGCGTLFNAEQTLSFYSDVDKVRVSIDGEQFCYTPCSIDIETAKKDLFITAEKEEYQTINTVLSYKIAGIPVFLDIVGGVFIVVGGLSSTSTDLSTGHLYEFSPSKYYFEMVPETVPAASNIMLNSPKFFTAYSMETLRIEAAQGGGEHTKTLAEMLQRDEAVLVDQINSEQDDGVLLEMTTAE